MLTRTLATLTLLLTFTAGTDPLPPASSRLDRASHSQRTHRLDADDLGGCREPAPALVPVAPASCSDEGQP
jgi:hypothetical protein